jgi:hypothetical protein
LSLYRVPVAPSRSPRSYCALLLLTVPTRHLSTSHPIHPIDTRPTRLSSTMAGGPPIDPFLHEPAAAPTIDTSPQTLGLEGNNKEHKSGNESSALDRSLSASGSFVKRALDRTAGMLSIPGTRVSSNAPNPASSPKRVLSVNRKNKGRETDQGILINRISIQSSQRVACSII